MIAGKATVYPQRGKGILTAGNQNGAVQAQIKRLEAQVASLTNVAAMERVLAAERAEKSEAMTKAMVINLGKLVGVMQELKDKPFGLRLGFVQGTLQAMNVIAQCMRDDRGRDTSKDFEKFGAVMLERSHPDWKPGKR